MDFLLDNPLAIMEGPTFLILYVLLIATLTAMLAIQRSRLVGSPHLKPPAIPPQIDAYEIAYLRGGLNELARTAVFALVRKGLVEVTSDDRKGRIKRVRDASPSDQLARLETEALHWVRDEREASDVFDTKTGLVKELEPAALVYRYDLEKRNLLAGEDAKRRIRKAALSAAAIIALLGGYKVVTAVLVGHFNIIFALLLAGVGVVLALAVGRVPRMTSLGKAYVERLQLVFEDVKHRPPEVKGSYESGAAHSQSGFVGVDPLLVSVGLFGTAVLAGSAFAGYDDVFQRQQQQGSSGACGSSCGGSSGGDGGGGSCSSGCGGGGCGGGCS